MNALTITPRQAYEVSRLLDRLGHGVVYGGVSPLCPEPAHSDAAEQNPAQLMAA